MNLAPNILTRSTTKLAKVLLRRRMSYRAAAREISRTRKCSPDHLGRIVRGTFTPPLPLARAIVAWVDNPRELKLSDLLGDLR